MSIIKEQISKIKRDVNCFDIGAALDAAKKRGFTELAEYIERDKRAYIKLLHEGGDWFEDN